MAQPSDIQDLQQRLALVESRLEQLFEHLDIAPREPITDATEDPEIQDLLVKGNVAQAVKRYRELTGSGIAEAQKAIEAAQTG
jgi:ribosomal protein L7/L12